MPNWISADPIVHVHLAWLEDQRRTAASSAFPGHAEASRQPWMWLLELKKSPVATADELLKPSVHFTLQVTEVIGCQPTRRNFEARQARGRIFPADDPE